MWLFHKEHHQQSRHPLFFSLCLVISIESHLLWPLGLHGSLWSYFLKCANKVYLLKWQTVRRDSQASIWGHHAFNVTPAVFILATVTRSQRWWRFCTFTMSNKVTEVLGLQRNLFGFLIYCSFNGNSGKALSAVIWFKFHCPFCISRNSLTSDSLVSCCASLRAVDVLICGFVIKF